MNNAADRITKFTVNGKTIDIPENAYSEVTLQYGFPFVIDKSPQKIEIIKSIPNFDFNIPVLGNGNISNGNITISIPFINKGIMFNQSDLETFRQLLTK